MLYPICQPLPRPRFFPSYPDLARLIDSNFDPNLPYLKLSSWRREARDLRKGLFGPKGLRDVPKGEGARSYDLPNGWALRLTYGERPPGWREAGDVVVEVIPPGDRKRRPIPPNGHRHADEARP